MKKKLGEILVAAGAVSPADIELALVDQSAGEPARLGDLLVALGKITPLQLAHALCEQYDVAFTEIPPVPSAVLESVPLDFQRQFRFVPIEVQGNTITIAMADPSLATREVLPALRRQYAKVKIFVSAGDEVDAVHASLSGEYGSSPLHLPQVAPAIAPVKNRPTTPPTADDLFGSLDLDSPSTSGSFDLDLSDSVATKRPAGTADEEEPFFFEATLSPVAQPAPPAPAPVAPVVAPVKPSARPISKPIPPVVPSRPISKPLPTPAPIAPVVAPKPKPLPVPEPEPEPEPELPPMSSSPSFPDVVIEEEAPVDEPPSYEVSSFDAIDALGEPAPIEASAEASLDLPAFELPDAMPEFAADADAPPPMTEVPWDAAATVAAEPIPDAEAMAETAAFFDSQFRSSPSDTFVADSVIEEEVSDDGSEAMIEVSAEATDLPDGASTIDVQLDEDTPFFDSAQPGPSISAIDDDAFVPGVPASSPSSLALLEIPPEAPLISVVPPISFEVPADPEPLERSSGLPDWLQSASPAPEAEPAVALVAEPASPPPEEPPAGEWTGALDHLAPSKLIMGVTRALLKRGLVTEADILEALEPRK